MTKALWFTLTMLLATFASAEQKKDFGPYEVHYIAFPSTFLQPDIAARYNLTRSRAIGVANITVLRKTTTGTEPVAAYIRGALVNNIQQSLPLTFERVTEGKAIYSLASFQFSEAELLTFQLEIVPEGETQPLFLRFSQQLFSK